MINLIPIYWSEFKTDGLLFEQLIEELLNAMYPGQKFYKTKQTHDGNRDFEYYVPLLEGAQSKIWMECKYHTADALPIHDISMTLLMAYIEGVSQILIFSYSKVTNTFFNYIAEYKAKSGKEVTVYSDCELEELIFQYRKKIHFRKYFPQYGNSYQLIAEPELSCKYTLERNEKTISGNKDSTNITIALNEELSSKLYLINNGRDKKSIHLEIINDENLKCFESVFALNSSIEIPCHSSVVIPLVFRLRDYIENLQYPKIKISGNSNQYEIYSIPNKLEYRWLADAPIIGEAYERILYDCEKYISDIARLSVITLTGTSGIGKSRIIKEILFNAKKLNYQTCYVDSDKDIISAKFLLEKIISSISQLPLFDFEKRKATLFLTHENNEKVYAAHLLYDDNVDIEKEKKQIAKFLVELLRKKACILALDNVQKYDELSIELLDNIIEYSKDEKMSSKLIICFNNDYTYSGTDAYNFRRRLIYYASYNPERFYYKEIPGFKKEEARKYIEYCLNFDESNVERDNIQYKHSIESIINHFGNNPFFLKNILLYLEQEKILLRSKTTNYYIADATGFTQCMEILPPTIDKLIEMREELFLNKFSQTDIIRCDYKRTMQFMVLMRHMPHIMYHRIINNNDLLQDLLNIGFLEIDSNRTIHFIHTIYERYFDAKYLPEELSVKDLQDFILLSNQLYYEDTYFIQIFLAEYYLGILKKDLFEKALNKIIHWDIDIHLCSVFLPIISHILESEKFSTNISRYLEVYWVLSNIMTRREGIKSALNYIRKIKVKFFQDPVLFSNDITLLIQILKEGILHLINLRKVDAAHEDARNLLKKYTEVFLNSEYYNKTHLLDIYNCLTICEYHLDHLDEALSINDKVIALCDDNKEQLISALRSRGDIYYHNSRAWQYKKEISYWWHEAYDAYLQCFGNNLETDLKSHVKIATYIKALLSDLIEQQFIDANEKIKYLTRCLNNTDMLYYEIMIRLAKVIFLLTEERNRFEDYEDTYKEIINLLNQSTDMCVYYGNEYCYINCFYLRAICQLFFGKFDFAYDNFIKTFQLLSNILLNDKDYRAWKFFYIEMIIFAKKSNRNIPKNMLSSIRNDKLYDEIISIINMKADDFDAYLKHYKSCSPIHDKTGKNSFPKI